MAFEIRFVWTNQPKETRVREPSIFQEILKERVVHPGKMICTGSHFEFGLPVCLENRSSHAWSFEDVCVIQSVG